MKKVFGTLAFIYLLLLACNSDEEIAPLYPNNPEIELNIPEGFPPINPSVKENRPTEFGVELGKKLFNETMLSANNTISCASCHQQPNAFADKLPRAVGINDRVGLRNTPPIQNMAFMTFYNWDGNILQLEKQPLVPIITHEEMGSSISEVIAKLNGVREYKDLFAKAFGREGITPERIYQSISQYEYTLISSNSKYDRIQRGENEAYTESEKRGLHLFDLKCADCHSTALFTDQSFRNVGFPVNPDTDEAGRARVTGDPADYGAFRVPSLRNIEHTAPYGSFGQFPTLMAVLDYFDKGVIEADNLDPILKENGNRIPLSGSEKRDIIAFLKTLSDSSFVGK